MALPLFAQALLQYFRLLPYSLYAMNSFPHTGQIALRPVFQFRTCGCLLFQRILQASEQKTLCRPRGVFVMVLPHAGQNPLAREDLSSSRSTEEKAPSADSNSVKSVCPISTSRSAVSDQCRNLDGGMIWSFFFVMKHRHKKLILHQK